MTAKFLKIGFASILALGFAGCDDGDYSDLSCSESYEPECVDAGHYMTCMNGQLQIIVCDVGKKCTVSNEASEDGSVVKKVSCQ